VPFDREELAIMFEALALSEPSRLSPLPSILESADGAASRTWAEIRVPLDTGFDLQGTPDPTVTFTVNGNITSIVLHFTGHEDPTRSCGGFSELEIFSA
jgi:hypothetical protein